MKKTNYTLVAHYILIAHLRNGDTHEETYLDEQSRNTRIKELSQSANPKIGNDEIDKITTREDIVSEENFVFDIALIASIIAGEHHRSLMIKTLLSHVEVSKLIAAVAIDVYREIKSKYPKVLDPAAPQSPLLLQVTDLAAKLVWEKHNVKL